MVKKKFYLFLSILLLTSIYLSLFELLIHTFQTSCSLTWIYLLKQHYISLIDSDIFTIYEKRHLLDVKRLLETTQKVWIISLAFSLVILYFFKKSIKIISTIGICINFILLLFSFNFLNSFNLFHSLFFQNSTWFFPKNSSLLQCFPIEYFQNFLMLFLLISSLIFLFLLWIQKVYNK